MSAEFLPDGRLRRNISGLDQFVNFFNKFVLFVKMFQIIAAGTFDFLIFDDRLIIAVYVDFSRTGPFFFFVINTTGA